MRKMIDDYSPAEIARRNIQVAVRLRRSGVLGGQAIDPEALPAELCQARVAAIRKRVRRPVRWLCQRLDDGWPVYSVNVVVSEFMCEPGALKAKLFIEAKKWAERRLRRLARHGRYAAVGVVDVSFNDLRAINGESHWCVHFHMLVYMRTPQKYDVKKLLGDVFKADTDGRFPNSRPQVIVPVETTKKGIKGAREYIFSRLLAECQQRRESKLNQKGQKDTQDRPLLAEQQDELLRVLSDLRPERRVILSGFRTREGKIYRRKQTPRIARQDRYWPKGKRKMPKQVRTRPGRLA